MNTQMKPQRGFTLVEMIVVIVITGIIGSMVAVFIRIPVLGYTQSANRAALTDMADTAMRRMMRDVRTAVPNSLRIANCGGVPCVEYLATKDGGRYRAYVNYYNGSGNVLAFGTTTAPFDSLGTAIIFASGDQIVVGSTQSSGNIAYSSVANSGILRAVTGFGTLTTVNMATTALPTSAQLPSQRFDVVDGTQQAVTYACEGTLTTLDANGNGQASLNKHWAYGYNSSQTAPSTLGGSVQPLVNEVSACQINYDVSNQRFGLLTVSLTLTRNKESVTLYEEMHVNNAP